MPESVCVFGHWPNHKFSQRFGLNSEQQMSDMVLYLLLCLLQPHKHIHNRSEPSGIFLHGFDMMNVNNLLSYTCISSEIVFGLACWFNNNNKKMNRWHCHHFKQTIDALVVPPPIGKFNETQKWQKNPE